MATNASKIKISVQSQPPRVVRWGYHMGSKGTKKAMPLMIGIAGDGSVCRVSFAEGKTAPQLLREWERAWPETAFVEDKAATADAAKKIFSGGAAPLLLTGTKFQQSVWKELARIASGKTVSYADIARRIGNPKAMRAVGTACGANPVPLLIPCHRVVGSNGGLGGFTSGLAMKRILLKAEGVDPESLAA